MGSSETPEPFRSMSASEFFYRNRQMAGFGNPTQALYSTVRELVENSLDACEDAGHLPLVDVSIAEKDNIVEVTVSDNGLGIPYDKVPDAFGRVLFGSKYRARQRRGTFGLGATMAVLYSQITTDSPVIITTQIDDKVGKRYVLHIDVEENCPIVKDVSDYKQKTPGTAVTIRLEGGLARAEDRILEYLRLTSVSSPHATISYTLSSNGTTKFGHWHPEMPLSPKVCRPHPHAADFEVLKRLVDKYSQTTLSKFLIDAFQKVGIQKASDFLSFMSLDSKMIVGDMTREDIARLSKALKQYDNFGRPDSRCLSPIGKDPFLAGVRGVYGSSIAKYTSRSPSDWEGNPFIIEGVITIGDAFPISDYPTLYRFANRVPLLYDSSDDVLTKTMKKIDWKKYNVSKAHAIALFVSFCSTRVPYNAAGKQSIASVSEIEHEARLLFRDLGRQIGRILKKSKAIARKRKRMRVYSTNLRLIAKYAAELAGSEEAPDIETLVTMLFGDE